MTKVDDILDRLAKAAVEEAEPEPRSSGGQWRRAYLHDAATALSKAGIADDKLAAAITLARAETKLANLAEKGVGATPALRREISEMENILNV